jgi:hypothetical protein
MKFGKFEILLIATGIFLFGLGAVKNPQMSLMFFDILLGEHHELIGGFFILVSLFIFYLGFRKKPSGRSGQAPTGQDQPRQPGRADEESGGGKKKRKKKKDRNKGN